MPPPRVQAALALIERRGRYLICRRKPGGFLGGYWEFPGGKRKSGERWTACLRRELREELGVSVTSLRPVAVIRYRYPTRSILFRVFRCAIAQGRPRPLDAAALRWVPARQLRRFRFPPADRSLIVHLSSPSPAKRYQTPFPL